MLRWSCVCSPVSGLLHHYCSNCSQGVGLPLSSDRSLKTSRSVASNNTPPPHPFPNSGSKPGMFTWALCPSCPPRITHSQVYRDCSVPTVSEFLLLYRFFPCPQISPLTGVRLTANCEFASFSHFNPAIQDAFASLFVPRMLSLDRLTDCA